jgi:hypothetical protein
VDNEGEVPDFLVQRRRNANAAKKAKNEAAQEAGLRTNQDGDGQASVIPIGLSSYCPCDGPRSRSEGQQQGRELASAGSAQRLLSIHAVVYNTVYHQRNLPKRSIYKQLRITSFNAWQDASVAA